MFYFFLMWRTIEVHFFNGMIIIMEITDKTAQPLGTGGGGQKPPPTLENSSEEVKIESTSETVTLSDKSLSLMGTGGGGQKPPPNSK